MATNQQLINANRFSFLAAGFAVAAWAPMIPLIKDRYALNEHDLGLLLLCVGIGSMISMPTSGYFSSRFGCRLPVVVGGFVLGLILTVIAFINNLYLTAFLLVLFGMAAVTLDVVSNINAAIVEAIAKKDIMSGLHGLYSVGGFVGSLTVTSILSLQFSIEVAAIYSLIFLWACMSFGCRHLITDVRAHEQQQAADAAAEAAKEQNESQSAAKKSSLSYYTHPLVLMIGLMCFIMFMTEGSILDWSGVYLSQERGLPLEYAGYGYAAFAVMMTCCRLLGDKIVATFGRRRVLILGTLSIVAGYCLAVFTSHFVGALLGFALIGVGASNVVPQLVSVTARIKEVPIHISVTIVNTIGFTGMLCGPAFIGFLAQAISLPYTYLCQAASVLLVTAMVFMLFKRSHAQDSTEQGTANVESVENAEQASASASDVTPAQEREQDRFEAAPEVALQPATVPVNKD